jgi:hypothetical protein
MLCRVAWAECHIIDAAAEKACVSLARSALQSGLISCFKALNILLRYP